MTGGFRNASGPCTGRVDLGDTLLPKRKDGGSKARQCHCLSIHLGHGQPKEAWKSHLCHGWSECLVDSPASWAILMCCWCFTLCHKLPENPTLSPSLPGAKGGLEKLTWALGWCGQRRLGNSNSCLSDRSQLRRHLHVSTRNAFKRHRLFFYAQTVSKRIESTQVLLVL